MTRVQHRCSKGEGKPPLNPLKVQGCSNAGLNTFIIARFSCLFLACRTFLGKKSCIPALSNGYTHFCLHPCCTLAASPFTLGCSSGASTAAMKGVEHHRRNFTSSYGRRHKRWSYPREKGFYDTGAASPQAPGPGHQPNERKLTDMNRKPGLIREEHFELGRQLHAAFEIVSAASVQIGNAYASNSRQARAASAVYRDMITLKAVMDDAICREGPPNQAMPERHSGPHKSRPATIGLGGAAMPTPDPHRSATSAGAVLHAASHYLGLAAKHAKAAGNQTQLAAILDALAATRKAEHAGTAKLPRYPALQIVPRRPKKTPEEQAESDRAIANLYRAGGLPRDGTPRRR